jgi:hypothetical protein
MSKQLNDAQDAQVIANYSDPVFVPDEWSPVVGR